MSYLRAWSSRTRKTHGYFRIDSVILTEKRNDIMHDFPLSRVDCEQFSFLKPYLSNLRRLIELRWSLMMSTLNRHRNDSST